MRMSHDLRRRARGIECQIRIPGVCNHNPETSVLCHYRQNTGIGQKSPDLIAAVGCSDCHDAVDRRRFMDLDYDYVRQCHAEGVMRTLALWVREGLVSW